jgi:organic radical activating enzyme
MSFIQIEDRSALLEITDRCYNSCNNYCYKTSSVSPEGLHVPIEVVKQRIGWVKEYTNANSVTLLGGEPLLHPQLQEVIEYVQEQGYVPGIITSGKVPFEYQDNLQLVKDLHAQGEIDLELSYHSGSNETVFLHLLQYFKDSAGMRKKCLEQAVKEGNGDLVLARARLNSPTLHSTITLGNNPIRFVEVQKNILASIGIDTSTYMIEVEGQQVPVLSYFEQVSAELPHHFLPFTQSESFEFTYQIKEGSFTYEITSLGITGIIPERNGTVKIIPAKGTVDEGCVCPSMSTLVSKSKIKLESLLIRTDGEITYSEPACIAAKSMLGNVDNLTDRTLIYSSFLDTVKRISQLIIETKASRACSDKELCMGDPDFPEEFEDNYTCPSCEFDLACNVCVG